MGRPVAVGLLAVLWLGAAGCDGCETRPECFGDFACQTGQRCVGSACVGGGACAVDGDCGDGEHCDDGICLRRSCFQGCGNGATCSGFECRLVECALDWHCPPTEQCKEQICVSRGVCETDVDCFGEEICTDGRCTVGCRVDGDCEGARTCEGGLCMGEADLCTASGGTHECFRNRDCADTYWGLTAYCSRTEVCSRCRPLCNVAADCTKPEFEPVLCADGGCVCDDGVCGPPACSADSDCATGWCVGGHCADAPDPPADGCSLAPDTLVSREGATVAPAFFLTRGSDWLGRRRPPELTWSTGDASVAGVDPATGELTGGRVSGTTTLTATFATGACTAAVTNYAAPTAGELRVVVLEVRTHAPVSGARVVVVDAVSGTEVGQGDTGDEGAWTASPGASVRRHVHIFTPDVAGPEAPMGYGWVSVMDTNLTDLVVYLTPNASPSFAAGYRGRLDLGVFDAISSDDVHLALAGSSLPGPALNFSASDLWHPTIDTPVKFGNLIDEPVPLPTGLVLGVGREFFKDWYAPVGVPGERTAWALGGNLPLAEVTAVLSPIVGGGTSDLPLGQLVGALLPLFNRFNHAITPGVTLTARDRVILKDGPFPFDTGLPVTDANGAAILVPDFAAFPGVPIALDTRLELKGIVQVPTLPVHGPGYLGLAFLVGGAQVPGQGFVPLGLTAGFDVADDFADTPNGTVNDEGDDPSPGEVILRLAPAHGGLEGSPYRLVAWALDARSLVEPGPTPRAGLVLDFDELPFEAELPLPGVGGAFLPLPEGATWALTTRTHTPVAVAGASFQRLTFETPEGRRWEVYHDGSSALTLPATPVWAGERARADATVESQVLTSVVDLAGLFRFDGRDLDQLGDHVSAWSSLPLAP